MVATAPGKVDGAATEAGRHQLTVVAAGADLVAASGGWIYDRASAGWTVNVLVDTDGVRALTILGASETLYDVGAEAFRPVYPV